MGPGSLKREQIEASNCLYKIAGGPVTDSAIRLLADRLSNIWSEEAVLLRATVINSLYSTQIYNINEVAKQISKILENRSIRESVHEFVETVAEFDVAKSAKRKVGPSFSSKFCHFFLSEGNSCPIYDWYAEQSLRSLLGITTPKSHRPTYRDFCSWFEKLRSSAGTAVVNDKELDTFLWLRGLIEFANNRTELTKIPNSIVRGWFESKNEDPARWQQIQLVVGHALVFA